MFLLHKVHSEEVFGVHLKQVKLNGVSRSC